MIIMFKSMTLYSYFPYDCKWYYRSVPGHTLSCELADNDQCAMFKPCVL